MPAPGWSKRFRSLGLFAAIVIVGVVILWWFRSTTTVIVIRHAERNDAATCAAPPAGQPPRVGPPISDPAGTGRAQALVHVCGQTGISTVYASEFCRTQQTVEPLASQLGLTVNVIAQHSPDGTTVDVDELIDRIRSNDRGKIVLVAGHTDTVPVIIDRLSGVTIAPIGDGEFDNLYVVTISRWWWWSKWQTTKVVRLEYGAAN